jgi:hypothetical protein
LRPVDFVSQRVEPYYQLYHRHMEDGRRRNGPTATYGSMTALDASLAANHSMLVSGLTAGTQYHYRVRSRDAVGVEAIRFSMTVADAPVTFPF